MTNKERSELNTFPKALDAAVKNRFGIECETTYDFFGSMNYVTRHNAKGAMKNKVDEFISGFICGNTELRERIVNPEIWNS